MPWRVETSVRKTTRLCESWTGEPRPSNATGARREAIRKPGLPLGDRDCTGPGGSVGGGEISRPTDRKLGLPLGDRDCTGPGGPVGGGGGAIPRRHPTGRKPCLPLGDRDCTGHGGPVGRGAIPVPTGGHPRESASREVVANAASSHPFDPDGSHMLVSEIKPCTCKYASRTTETADGSLNQLRPTRSHRPRLHRITVVILELIRATNPDFWEGRIY